MHSIKFPYPIVLYTASAKNLNADDAKLLRDTLRGRYTFRDGELIQLKGSGPAEYVTDRYGSEAAIAYFAQRRELDKLVLVPGINPDRIVTLAPCVFAALDLLWHMQRVANRVSRLRRLRELSAPQIIMRNEDRILWEYVEWLFFNGNTDVMNPVTYNDIDDDTDEEIQVPYLSVSDFTDKLTPDLFC